MGATAADTRLEGPGPLRRQRGTPVTQDAPLCYWSAQVVSIGLNTIEKRSERASTERQGASYPVLAVADSDSEINNG